MNTPNHSLEDVAIDTVPIVFRDRTIQASVLTARLLAQAGAKWRQERIEQLFGVRRVMFMAPDMHTAMVVEIAKSKVDVADIMRDADLQRCLLQVAVENHDPKFDAGNMTAHELQMTCIYLLGRSGYETDEKGDSPNPTNGSTTAADSPT